VIEPLLRELAPQVLGAVVRRYRDFAAAEDAVQEALIAAAAQWPTDGLPDNPRGWLITVAVRRMTDHIRAELARRRRESDTAEAATTQWPAIDDVPELGHADHDDTLVLLYMCCHPALTPSSAVALTLRAVGGLTTAEIANAYLVPESTMAQRISRAKAKVKGAGGRFEMPSAQERSARLSTVLHVIYLIFNEGYASSIGSDLVRTDLSHEAIRLARVVRTSLPREPEVAGLLALMLLTDARRAARTGPEGELIPLDEQNRGLWDHARISEGARLISSAFGSGPIGPYQVQAAIASLHDEAATVHATDWPQIAALYGALMTLEDNPMVALNHAIAVAMVDGPARGLALLADLERDARIANHYRLDAVRGHLCERAGDLPAAIAHFRRAASKTTSVPEQHYLRMKAARLAAERSD
jgi:RNA polymerase sigma factor (sigma-70 family)